MTLWPPFPSMGTWKYRFFGVPFPRIYRWGEIFQKKYWWWYDGVEIYPQNIDGVTLRVENLQVKLCDVYVGRPTGGLAHHCLPHQCPKRLNSLKGYKNCWISLKFVFNPQATFHIFIWKISILFFTTIYFKDFHKKAFVLRKYLNDSEKKFWRRPDTDISVKWRCFEIQFPVQV